MNIMSHIGQPSMWVHLSYNSRNGMRLSYIAANSKPIPGLELKTRNFGGKIDVIYLGSTLMHFVHLLKLSLNLERLSCWRSQCNKIGDLNSSLFDLDSFYYTTWSLKDEVRENKLACYREKSTRRSYTHFLTGLLAYHRHYAKQLNYSHHEQTERFFPHKNLLSSLSNTEAKAAVPHCLSWHLLYAYLFWQKNGGD